MRNLKLSAKIGMLVAVLLATALIVGIVGVVELWLLDDRFDRMANTTSKAGWLSGDARIELLTAIRAEKNAILAVDKAKAEEFAALAQRSTARLKEIRAEIESLVGVNQATTEGRALAELSRVLDSFEANSSQLLRLAVQKSNVEGKRVVGELYRQARDMEEFVRTWTARDAHKTSSSTAPAEASNSSTPREVAARQALERFYELLFLLTLHLESADEQAKTRIEDDIHQSVDNLQDALRRFSPLLNESERTDAWAAMRGADSIKARVTHILQLSRTNSDNLAEQLSMTRGVELGTRCSDLFEDVRRAMRTRISDEVGEMARAARTGRSVVIGTTLIGGLISLVLALLTLRSISQVVSQIRTVAGQLGASAGELTKVSTDLVSQSHEMTTQAESVASGSEQMSTNVASIAAAAEQVSVNVSSISSASEEVSMNVNSILQSAEKTSRNVGLVAEAIDRITTSMQGVARDARHGSQITSQARDMTAAATGTMRQLDQAASEITKVTEVIKMIALQTNLLALNATIEATSAGEAGKGFAVVASEVKELAGQSAQSAEEIARKIESVQVATREAVKVIENVAQFVSQVNESAGRISESVDGQTQAAGQIVTAVGEARHGVESIARSIAEVGQGATDVSRNTSEAASAATDVSRNAGEAASATGMISANIHGVSEATRLSTVSSGKVNEAARRLDQMAAELRHIVARFLAGEVKAVPEQPGWGSA